MTKKHPEWELPNQRGFRPHAGWKKKKDAFKFRPVDHLKYGGNYTPLYTTFFNIQKLCVVSTHCLYVFRISV